MLIFEAADAEPGKVALDPVHDGRALANYVLTLSAWPFHILDFLRGDRRHAAMVWFAAEPAEESALEQLGIEAICLRAAMLARDWNARRMNDIGFDFSIAKPPGQPEAIAPGLIGDDDSLSIEHPARIASLRQRCRRTRRASWSTAGFFSG